MWHFVTMAFCRIHPQHPLHNSAARHLALQPAQVQYSSVIFSPNLRPKSRWWLTNNCHPSSITHRFWYIASQSRKQPHHGLSPQINETAFKFRCQIYQLLLCENRVILTSVILSQYTRDTNDRQATYHDNRLYVDVTGTRARVEGPKTYKVSITGGSKTWRPLMSNYYFFHPISKDPGS